MTDHRDDDDSILDKAKDAIGMESDDEDASADRPAGWAGVDDALGGADREPGSVYEAEERTDADTLGSTHPVDHR